MRRRTRRCARLRHAEHAAAAGRTSSRRARPRATGPERSPRTEALRPRSDAQNAALRPPAGRRAVRAPATSAAAPRRSCASLWDPTGFLNALAFARSRDARRRRPSTRCPTRRRCSTRCTSRGERRALRRPMAVLRHARRLEAVASAAARAGATGSGVGGALSARRRRGRRGEAAPRGHGARARVPRRRGRRDKLAAACPPGARHVVEEWQPERKLRELTIDGDDDGGSGGEPTANSANATSPLRKNAEPPTRRGRGAAARAAPPRAPAPRPARPCVARRCSASAPSAVLRPPSPPGRRAGRWGAPTPTPMAPRCRRRRRRRRWRPSRFDSCGGAGAAVRRR